MHFVLVKVRKLNGEYGSFVLFSGMKKKLI